MLKFLPCNILINKVLLVGAVLTLSACSSNPSSTPVMSQFEPQYCHTNEDIVLKDGQTVSSDVRLTCTDNPADKHFLAYSELAKNCREHFYQINIAGKWERQRGFVCQKFDGSWEIVNHPF